MSTGERDDLRGSSASADSESLEPQLAWLGPFGSERTTREVALVLQSMGIEHITASGGMIAVAAADATRARAVVTAYARENRDWPPRRTRERARYAGLPLVALAFALLVVFSVVTGPSRAPHGNWFREGASVASLVVGSEPFRAVTALTLHADAEHVVGNLLSGALFGRAVERRLGPGGALLAIVSAGALGNLANAAFYVAQGVAHSSIGASTAVFGAVGVLGATQIALHLRDRKQAKKPDQKGLFWSTFGAPIAGGLALLATLGASPKSDLWAHAWGLCAGLVVGAVAALATQFPSPIARGKQAAMSVAALAIVGGSWVAALA